MRLGSFCAIAVGLFILNGCALTGKGTLYVEPSSRGAMQPPPRRIAVVPNRLPTMLTDPETWRRHNFGLLEKDLRSRGFDVVDYDSSVRAFEQSGLPVEDTRSSRDKYAELAAQLGVDAIVIPYYGTFAATHSLAMVNTNVYTSVATLQLYSAQKNDFTMRIDATGKYSYTSGVFSAVGTITSIVGAGVGLGASGGCPGCGIAGGVLALVGAGLNIFDLIFSAIAFGAPPEDRWKDAFGAAIKQGLQPMYAALGLATPPPAPRPIAPSYAPPPTAPGCTSDADCKAGRVCIRGECTTR